MLFSKSFRYVLLSLSILLFPVSTLPAISANRVAFVVGVNEYKEFPDHLDLTRPVNNAEAMSDELKNLGYRVVLAKDTSRKEFYAKWEHFLGTIKKDDVAAIFLSGHGVEIDGENFFLPSDVPHFKFGRHKQTKRESISIQELLEDLHGLRERRPRITLMILDACRSDPTVPSNYQMGDQKKGGLNSMVPPDGTFIMYSAGVKQTALERISSNDPSEYSVYVRALLPLIRQRHLNIVQIARNVMWNVVSIAGAVNHPQRPAYYDNIIGDFCLGGCERGSLTAEGRSMIGGPPAKSPMPPDASNRQRFMRSVEKPSEITAESSRRLSDAEPKKVSPPSPDVATGSSINNPQDNVISPKTVVGTHSKIHQQIAGVPRQKSSQVTVHGHTNTTMLTSESIPLEEATPKSVLSGEKLARALQRALNRTGCNAGDVDGKWGRNSRAALVKFNKYTSSNLPTQEPSSAALDVVNKHDDRTCPPMVAESARKTNAAKRHRNAAVISEKPVKQPISDCTVTGGAVWASSRRESCI